MCHDAQEACGVGGVEQGEVESEGVVIIIFIIIIIIIIIFIIIIFIIIIIVVAEQEEVDSEREWLQGLSCAPASWVSHQRLVSFLFVSHQRQKKLEYYSRESPKTKTWIRIYSQADKCNNRDGKLYSGRSNFAFSSETSCNVCCIWKVLCIMLNAFVGTWGGVVFVFVFVFVLFEK